MTGLYGSADRAQMQGICDVAESPKRTTWQVAGQSFVVETQDNWAAKVIEALFAGWYLTPEIIANLPIQIESAADLIIKSSIARPPLPGDWQPFEIAGGGQCYSDGQAFWINIDDSIVAIGQPGKAAVEVWLNGPLPVQSPVLTRVVTYALAAALRRRSLFELHSGAVVDPVTDQGVLIIGPSGSGKSTLTVQLATAGWPFLTDDVLLLGDNRESVKAWPLRRCFAVTADTFTASDFLQTHTALSYAGGEREDKKQFAPHGVFASHFQESCKPRTLFFSVLAGAERSQVSALSPGETMTRLIRMNPWSCYDRTTAPDHLALLSKLVRQTTAYELRAGRDLLEPATSARLISSYTRA